MTAVEAETTAASPEVQLDAAGPQPQRRVTIAFRAILAIPHWIWLYLVGIAAAFAIIGAWFGALFTGRVPEGLHTFLGRYLRYYTRVLAYSGLLTDQYPSFELDADDYPYELVLPARGRLNRAAVFFRYFLVFPAVFVAGAVGMGLGVCMFFIWLIVLVKGRVPRSLHQAMTAVLRYSMRFYAYYTLLTSEYPHKLYGDKPEPAPTEEPAPLDLESAPPPTGEPLADLPVEGRSSRLVLSKAAKRLVTFFIVLAGVLFVALMIVGVVTGTQADRAADRLEDQHAVLDADIRQFGTTIQTCGIEGGVDCVHKADRDFARALTAFRAELRGIDYPRNALGIAHALEDDTDELIDLLHQREATSDLAEYQDLTVRFQDAATRFDRDYSRLVFTLRGLNGD